MQFKSYFPKFYSQTFHTVKFILQTNLKCKPKRQIFNQNASIKSFYAPKITKRKKKAKANKTKALLTKTQPSILYTIKTEHQSSRPCKNHKIIDSL